MWLIIGVPAAGKSTVADLLARRLGRSVHVRGGQFCRWAVDGWVHPTGGSTMPSEARRLLDLRYRLSALVADEYAEAGFTAVVQDNVFGADVVAWLERLRSRPRHLVVLCPSVEAVTERDAARQRERGKIAYQPGEFTIDGLDAELRSTPRLGLWLDTSLQTPGQSVDEIVMRRAEAVVP